MKYKNYGFTLIEIIIVVGIIGLLASIAVVSFSKTRIKARDTKRKAEIAQIGRYFAATSCFIPQSGPGDYDFADLYGELKAKYPQISTLFKLPVDPKSGSDSRTNYNYKVDSVDRCILYTNLENENETISLPGLTAPETGKGSGTFRTSANGVNGTQVYYQYSK